jgi:pSer/pThr/pTyr-binding forkhead associated (FHA) protein
VQDVFKTPFSGKGGAMSAPVQVIVRDGELPARQYVFDRRTTCKVGRAHDCAIKLPNDEMHFIISRHHCELDIDPPAVRVRDLGSRNGTFLNGVNIGQRRQEKKERSLTSSPGNIELRPGDEIRLGDTILEVSTGAGEQKVDAEKDDNTP